MDSMYVDLLALYCFLQVADVKLRPGYRPRTGLDSVDPQDLSLGSYALTFLCFRFS